jgi:hypothetical protein
MAKKKSKKQAKPKPKVKVLKIEKLAPNKVAVALEVEDAPELPKDPNWMPQWLKSILATLTPGGTK